MEEIDLKVADEVAKNANKQISDLNKELLKYKQEQRFMYVIVLCFIFVLLTAFVLTLLKVVDLTIVNEIQISKFAQNLICIPMYFINMFFVFSFAFEKLNRRLWICILICTTASIILSGFIPERYGIITSGILPILCILVSGILFCKNRLGNVLSRLGLFTFIIAAYQQLSRFIKLNGFGFDLFQCNIIVSIIYSIDLYLFYLLLLKVVKLNVRLVGTVEIPFRFKRFLKETCKEILNNRQIEDASDLNKRQRRVFALLVWGYTILQYAVIIGLNILINKFIHHLGSFYIGIIELIVAAVELELFRLVLGKTFHSNKIKICNIISFVVFFIISRFAMPLQISLFVNICVSAIIAYIIHILVIKKDELDEMKAEKEQCRDYKLEPYCDKNVLLEICRVKEMSVKETALLIEHYSNNKTYSEMQLKFNYSERHLRRLINSAEKKFYS